jgi:UDP-glucose 6-dehydrogenase
MRIKIYGYGWVGKAMATLFPSAVVVDPAYGMTSEEVCDVGIICVPTPLKDGKLDCSIVRQLALEVKEPLLLIRSTVMPGTCRELEKVTGKAVVFQPEYLGETTSHPMTDQHSRPFVILGGRPLPRQKIYELYQTVYNANVRFRMVTAHEAEIIKLSENRAIAFKVAQCQELYDVCQKAAVDYNTIREAVYGDDPRFNLWWTFVYPQQRGFNSKCIPKDVYGWAAWAESLGYHPELTRTMLAINEGYIKGPNELQPVEVGSTHATE